MHRRGFCKTTLATAVAAAIPACGRDTTPVATDGSKLINAASSAGEPVSIEAAAIRMRGELMRL